MRNYDRINDLPCRDLGPHRDDRGLGAEGIGEPLMPIYEPFYDLRLLVACLKVTLGIDEISLANLPAIVLSSPPLHQLVGFLNNLPQPEP